MRENSGPALPSIGVLAGRHTRGGDGARLSDEVKQKIFMGNPRQMLLPIFEAKGIRA